MGYQVRTTGASASSVTENLARVLRTGLVGLVFSFFFFPLSVFLLLVCCSGGGDVWVLAAKSVHVGSTGDAAGRHVSASDRCSADVERDWLSLIR